MTASQVSSDSTDVEVRACFFLGYSKGVSKVFVVNKYCVWWSQWSPVVLGSSIPNFWNGCKNRLNRTEHRNIRRFTMLMSSGTNGMVPMGCQQWTRLLFFSQYIWLVFGTFFIFHNIWDNPSHWLIFFKMVKTTNQIYNYRTVNKISDSTTLNILNCALALILYCQYDRYDVWLHLCAHFSRCSTPWCLTFRLMRRRRCHRCPPFESSFPQEICTYCVDCVIRKTCWLMETFCIVSQFFCLWRWGLIVGLSRLKWDVDVFLPKLFLQTHSMCF